MCLWDAAMRSISAERMGNMAANSWTSSVMSSSLTLHNTSSFSTALWRASSLYVIYWLSAYLDATPFLSDCWIVICSGSTAFALSESYEDLGEPKIFAWRVSCSRFSANAVKSIESRTDCIGSIGVPMRDLISYEHGELSTCWISELLSWAVRASFALFFCDTYGEPITIASGFAETGFYNGALFCCSATRADGMRSALFRFPRGGGAGYVF